MKTLLRPFQALYSFAIEVCKAVYGIQSTIPYIFWPAVIMLTPGLILVGLISIGLIRLWLN